MEIPSLRPEIGLELFKLILLRESYLKRLEKCLQQPKQRLDLNVVGMIDLLRETTISVVEMIDTWEKTQVGYPDDIRPFPWNGENYLTKVTHDLDWLDNVSIINTWLDFPLIGNPFLVPPETLSSLLALKPGALIIFGQYVVPPRRQQASKKSVKSLKSPYTTPIINDPQVFRHLSAQSKLNKEFQSTNRELESTDTFSSRGGLITSDQTTEPVNPYQCYLTTDMIEKIQRCWNKIHGGFLEHANDCVHSFLGSTIAELPSAISGTVSAGEQVPTIGMLATPKSEWGSSFEQGSMYSGSSNSSQPVPDHMTQLSGDGEEQGAPVRKPLFFAHTELANSKQAFYSTLYEASQESFKQSDSANESHRLSKAAEFTVHSGDSASHKLNVTSLQHSKLWTPHEINLQRQVQRRGGELFAVTAAGVKGRLKAPWRKNRFDRMTSDLQHLTTLSEQLAMSTEDQRSRLSVLLAKPRGPHATIVSVEEMNNKNVVPGPPISSPSSMLSVQSTPKRSSLRKSNVSNIVMSQAQQEHQQLVDMLRHWQGQLEAKRDIDNRKRFLDEHLKYFHRVAENGTLTSLTQQRERMRLSDGQAREADQLVSMALEDSMARKLQNLVRRVFGKALRKARIATRHRAATTIQCQYRTHRVNQNVLLRTQQLRLARMLLKAFRMYKASQFRQQLRLEAAQRLSATFIQRVYRGYCGRRRLGLKRKMVYSLHSARDCVTVLNLLPGHVEELADMIEDYIRDFSVQLPIEVLTVLRGVLFCLNGDAAECVLVKTEDGYIEKKYVFAASSSWYTIKLVLRRKARFLRRMRALISNSLLPNPSRIRLSAQAVVHLRSIRDNISLESLASVQRGGHFINQCFHFVTNIAQAYDLQHLFPEYFDPGLPYWFRNMMRIRSEYDRADIARRMENKANARIEEVKRLHTREGKKFGHIRAVVHRNNRELEEAREHVHAMKTKFNSCLRDLLDSETKELLTLEAIARAKQLARDVAEGDLKEYMRATLIPDENYIKELQNNLDAKSITMIQAQTNHIRCKERNDRNLSFRDFDKIMKLKSVQELAAQAGKIKADLLILLEAWHQLTVEIGGTQYVKDLVGPSLQKYNTIEQAAAKLLESRNATNKKIDLELQSQYDKVYRLIQQSNMLFVDKNWDTPTTIESDYEDFENMECSRRDFDAEFRKRRQLESLELPAPFPWTPLLIFLDIKFPREFLSSIIRALSTEFNFESTNWMELVAAASDQSSSKSVQDHLQEILDRKHNVLAMSNRGFHVAAQMKFDNYVHAVINVLVPKPRVLYLSAENAFTVDRWLAHSSIERGYLFSERGLKVDCFQYDLMLGKIRKIGAHVHRLLHVFPLFLQSNALATKPSNMRTDERYHLRFFGRLPTSLQSQFAMDFHHFIHSIKSNLLMIRKRMTQQAQRLLNRKSMSSGSSMAATSNTNSLPALHSRGNESRDHSPFIHNRKQSVSSNTADSYSPSPHIRDRKQSTSTLPDRDSASMNGSQTHAQSPAVQPRKHSSVAFSQQDSHTIPGPPNSRMQSPNTTARKQSSMSIPEHASVPARSRSSSVVHGVGVKNGSIEVANSVPIELPTGSVTDGTSRRSSTVPNLEQGSTSRLGSARVDSESHQFGSQVVGPSLPTDASVSSGVVEPSDADPFSELSPEGWMDFILAVNLAIALGLYNAPISPWSHMDIYDGVSRFRQYLSTVTIADLSMRFQQFEVFQPDDVAKLSKVHNHMDDAIYLQAQLKQNKDFVSIWEQCHRIDYYKQPARALLTRWLDAILEFVSMTPALMQSKEKSDLAVFDHMMKPSIDDVLGATYSSEARSGLIGEMMHELLQSRIVHANESPVWKLFFDRDRMESTQAQSLGTKLFRNEFPVTVANSRDEAEKSTTRRTRSRRGSVEKPKPPAAMSKVVVYHHGDEILIELQVNIDNDIVQRLEDNAVLALQKVGLLPRPVVAPEGPINKRSKRESKRVRVQPSDSAIESTVPSAVEELSVTNISATTASQQLLVQRRVSLQMDVVVHKPTLTKPKAFRFFARFFNHDLALLIQPNFTEIFEGKVQKPLSQLILESDLGHAKVSQEDKATVKGMKSKLAALSKAKTWTREDGYYHCISNWTCIDSIGGKLSIATIRARYLILSKLGNISGHHVRCEVYEERFGEIRILLFGLSNKALMGIVEDSSDDVQSSDNVDNDIGGDAEPDKIIFQYKVNRNVLNYASSFCDESIEREALSQSNTLSMSYIFTDRLQIEPSAGWYQFLRFHEFLPVSIHRRNGIQARLQDDLGVDQSKKTARFNPVSADAGHTFHLQLRTRGGPGRLVGRKLLNIKEMFLQEPTGATKASSQLDNTSDCSTDDKEGKESDESWFSNEKGRFMILMSVYEVNSENNAQELRIVLYHLFDSQTAEYRISSMERLLLFQDDSSLLTQLLKRLRLSYCDVNNSSMFAYERALIVLSEIKLRECEQLFSRLKLKEFEVEGAIEYEICSDDDDEDDDEDDDDNRSADDSSSNSSSLQASSNSAHRRNLKDRLHEREINNSHKWRWAVYFDRNPLSELRGNLVVSSTIVQSKRGFAINAFDPRTFRESFHFVHFHEAARIIEEFSGSQLEQELENLDESIALDLLDTVLSKVEVVDSASIGQLLVLRRDSDGQSDDGSTKSSVSDDNQGKEKEKEKEEQNVLLEINEIQLARLKELSSAECVHPLARKKDEQISYRITIHIYRAKELARQGMLGVRNPVALLKYNMREVGRSSIAKGTLSPDWTIDGASCAIDIMINKQSLLDSAAIDIDVFDTDAKGTMTDFLGQARLSGNELKNFLVNSDDLEAAEANDPESAPRELTTKWLPLMPSKRLSESENKHAQGKLEARGVVRMIGDRRLQEIAKQRQRIANDPNAQRRAETVADMNARSNIVPWSPKLDAIMLNSPSIATALASAAIHSEQRTDSASSLLTGFKSFYLYLQSIDLSAIRWEQMVSNQCQTYAIPKDCEFVMSIAANDVEVTTLCLPMLFSKALHKRLTVNQKERDTLPSEDHFNLSTSEADLSSLPPIEVRFPLLVPIGLSKLEVKLTCVIPSMASDAGQNLKNSFDLTSVSLTGNILKDTILRSLFSELHHHQVPPVQSMRFPVTLSDESNVENVRAHGEACLKFSISFNTRFIHRFYKLSVLSARDLAKADLLGKSDPFVRVFFNNELLGQTHHIRNTLNPSFVNQNEEFLLKVPRGTSIADCKLEVQIIDYDMMSQGDLLGYRIIAGEELVCLLESNTNHSELDVDICQSTCPRGDKEISKFWSAHSCEYQSNRSSVFLPLSRAEITPADLDQVPEIKGDVELKAVLVDPFHSHVRYSEVDRQGSAGNVPLDIKAVVAPPTTGGFSLFGKRSAVDHQAEHKYRSITAESANYILPSLIGSYATTSNIGYVDLQAWKIELLDFPPHRVERELALTRADAFTLRIHSAKGLANADLLGKSDPFVKLFWNGLYIGMTNTLDDTVDPLWDTSFVVTCAAGQSLSNCHLELLVFDRDNEEEGDFLGSLRLSGDLLEDLLRTEGNPLANASQPRQSTIASKHRKVHPKGFILQTSPKFTEKQNKLVKGAIYLSMKLVTDVSTSVPSVPSSVLPFSIEIEHTMDHPHSIVNTAGIPQPMLPGADDLAPDQSNENAFENIAVVVEEPGSVIQKVNTTFALTLCSVHLTEGQLAKLKALHGPHFSTAVVDCEVYFDNQLWYVIHGLLRPTSNEINWVVFSEETTASAVASLSKKGGLDSSRAHSSSVSSGDAQRLLFPLSNPRLTIDDHVLQLKLFTTVGSQRSECRTKGFERTKTGSHLSTYLGDVLFTGAMLREFMKVNTQSSSDDKSSPKVWYSCSVQVSPAIPLQSSVLLDPLVGNKLTGQTAIGALTPDINSTSGVLHVCMQLLRTTITEVAVFLGSETSRPPVNRDRKLSTLCQFISTPFDEQVKHWRFHFGQRQRRAGLTNTESLAVFRNDMEHDTDVDDSTVGSSDSPSHAEAHSSSNALERMRSNRQLHHQLSAGSQSALIASRSRTLMPVASTESQSPTPAVNPLLQARARKIKSEDVTRASNTASTPSTGSRVDNNSSSTGTALRASNLLLGDRHNQQENLLLPTTPAPTASPNAQPQRRANVMPTKSESLLTSNAVISVASANQTSTILSSKQPSLADISQDVYDDHDTETAASHTVDPVSRLRLENNAMNFALAIKSKSAEDHRVYWRGKVTPKNMTFANEAMKQSVLASRSSRLITSQDMNSMQVVSEVHYVKEFGDDIMDDASEEDVASLPVCVKEVVSNGAGLITRMFRVELLTNNNVLLGTADIEDDECDFYAAVGLQHVKRVIHHNSSERLPREQWNYTNIFEHIVRERLEMNMLGDESGVKRAKPEEDATGGRKRKMAVFQANGNKASKNESSVVQILRDDYSAVEAFIAKEAPQVLETVNEVDHTESEDHDECTEDANERPLDIERLANTVAASDTSLRKLSPQSAERRKSSVGGTKPRKFNLRLSSKTHRLTGKLFSSVVVLSGSNPMLTNRSDHFFYSLFPGFSAFFPESTEALKLVFRCLDCQSNQLSFVEVPASVLWESGWLQSNFPFDNLMSRFRRDNLGQRLLSYLYLTFLPDKSYKIDVRIKRNELVDQSSDLDKVEVYSEDNSTVKEEQASEPDEDNFLFENIDDDVDDGNDDDSDIHAQ